MRVHELAFAPDARTCTSMYSDLRIGLRSLSNDGFFFSYDGAPESAKFRGLADLAKQKTNNTTVVIIANIELDKRLRDMYAELERHLRDLNAAPTDAKVKRTRGSLVRLERWRSAASPARRR
jgi:hypothetical protein